MTQFRNRFILTASFAAILLQGAPVFAQNMFRDNASHNTAFAATAPSFDKPAWVFKTNGPVFSSASVADGVVYLGSDDRNLYAVDLASGAKKWSFASGGQIRSTPAVADGLVYFISYDSKVYALDAATGAKKWEFLTAGEKRFEAKHLHGCIPETQIMPDFWDTYESSPSVVDGTVYIGCGDGNFYALDAKTGALRWKFATGDVVHCSPAVVGGVVYFGSWDSFFYALDAKTGAEKWRFKTGVDEGIHNQVGVQASPVVKDGVVYFGCRDSHFYALDAATGARKWAYDNKGTWINASAVVADGMVYFVTSDPPFFVGLDAATGAEKFKVPAPFILFSSPVVAGNRFYAGSFDGVLYSCALDGGAVKAAFATQASVDNHRLIYGADGKVDYTSIFKDNDFDEMYFSARKFYDSGAILASPVISGKSFLFGSADGNLYCFR